MADARVAGAALVPGMPHLLADEAFGAESWKRLADANREVGERIRATDPDVIVVLSTQWFTVLGHQFQMDPHPKGDHVDENWYDYDFGHVSYDYNVDTEFTARWAQETERAGMQARLTNYDGFPIDIGTITASKLLDPHGELTAAQVSCNLYAEPQHLRDIGAAAVRTSELTDTRIFVLAVSGLSSGLIQEWIEPQNDRIFSDEHDRWNQRVLGLLQEGDVDTVMKIRDEYARAAAVDSQFRALAFLVGTGSLGSGAELLEYGHIWGTGAAVLYWDD